MTDINPSIFKAYDIRGLYPEEFDEDVTYRIGRGLTTLLQKELNREAISIGVANDMRLSSPQLKGQVIKGMLDQGATVYDLGFATTPTFYFGVAYYHLDGGLQVSASHNPAQFNGFKLVRQRSIPISEATGMNLLKDLVIQNSWSTPSKLGCYRTYSNLVDTAIKSLVNPIDLQAIKPLTIVVDTANSMGILDLEPLFNLLPRLKVTYLNRELDGKFPNHEADPLKEENLKTLEAAVLENKADLGISPDGDGDRYFFIDDQGYNIRQEIIRGLMAEIALKENPGATVCYDIRPGKITLDMIVASGGKPSVTRVGHSLIKEQMLKEGAVFGGESSGHYFYKTDWGTFETPLILVTKFLANLSQKNQPLSAVVKPLKRYFHSGEINSDVPDPSGKIQEIAKKYAAADINYLDGITVTYKDFWFNVRPSNTEPKLRLNLEAISKEIMLTKRDEVLHLIRN